MLFSLYYDEKNYIKRVSVCMLSTYIYTNNAYAEKVVYIEVQVGEKLMGVIQKDVSKITDGI